jgi:predicted DNA-binding helix-hairpin-helix protein
MNVVNEIQSIEKEQIKFLTFSKSEVLRKKNDQLNRFLDLKRALALGNLERGKVKITFVDDTGLKMVETTIWALTDESVVLKKSTIIPLQRILKVA